LCLMLQENGAAYGAVTTQIMARVMSFFENTHYALVTHDFQPRLLGLLSAFRDVPSFITEPIPTESNAVRAWLDDRRTLPNGEWADQVERIWRYQTDAECYVPLFDALERLVPDSPDLYERLYRRLVFGLQFVTKDEQMRRTTLLANASNKTDPVIRAMTSYLVDEIATRLQQDATFAEGSKSAASITAELAALEQLRRNFLPPSPPDLSRIPIGEPDELLSILRRLASRPLRLVIEKEWTAVAQLATRKRYEPQQILTSLARALQSENKFERAVALIVLGRMCEQDCLHETYILESFLPTGDNHELVTRRLLDAAAVTEQSQFESVGACQVYDLAVWAMRTIFLGLSSTHGLPLATF